MSLGRVYVYQTGSGGVGVDILVELAQNSPVPPANRQKILRMLGFEYEKTSNKQPNTIVHVLSLK